MKYSGYKLAADYGISITLGPGFNTIPAENLDMSKVKEKFRQLASLKGTYYMLPQGQASKDGTVNYSCMKKKSRSRAMYSDEFDSGNVYNFASEKLDYGLTGYCRAEFMYSSYSKLCKVKAWIKDSGKNGKSECNIKSEVKKNNIASFRGTVDYSYEYRELFGSGCMDSHCDTSGKCTCINGCWPTCDGEYCSYCGSEDGIKYCTVTITYEVKGECTRDSGKITWDFVGRDE